MAENERAHSELGGSTANRWINCTASVALIRTVPRPESTPAADEGTKAHEIAQILLEDYLAHKLEGTDPDIRAHLLSYNDDMLEHAHAFRDAVWKRVLNEAITGKAYGLEEEFTFSTELKAYGFIDFWAVYIDDRGKRVGVIVDYKYGYKHVEAENNDQLRFYAAALLREIREGGKDLDKIRCIIFQPRDGYPESYREVAYTSAQLDKWSAKALKAAHAIFVTKKTKLKVGEWCSYCPAQAVCVKYKEDLEQRTSLKLLEVDKELLAAPESISNETISKLILHYDEIMDLFKACKKYALSKALNGTLPGVKVVEGPSRRKWIDEATVASELEPVLEDDELFKKKVRGITDVERALKKKLPKDEAMKMLDGLVGRTTPPLLLVADNDPRQAVSGSLEMLGALDGEETN